MYCRYFKRFLDIVLSLGALAALSPVMAITALLIKLEDGGNILFRQKRIGKNGIEFDFLKLRSMPMDAANLPKTEAAEIKITGIGKIIRRSNIDELPQLLNIIKGDMSIVGPRPAISSQVSLCRMRDENGASKCLPGLTGLAQVNAYDGMPEDKKAGFDADYVKNISFINDFRIILKTLAYLTRKPPVY
jgi:O-antigen biosynthesis protein WbqP